jgi:hypothetical protein
MTFSILLPLQTHLSLGSGSTSSGGFIVASHYFLKKHVHLHSLFQRMGQLVSKYEVWLSDLPKVEAKTLAFSMPFSNFSGRLETSGANLIFVMKGCVLWVTCNLNPSSCICSTPHRAGSGTTEITFFTESSARTAFISESSWNLSQHGNNCAFSAGPKCNVCKTRNLA